MISVMVKVGIGGAVVSWIIYGVILFNSYQNQIPIPPEYDWAKQIIAFIPVILGHHFLAYRYHTRDNR